MELLVKAEKMTSKLSHKDPMGKKLLAAEAVGSPIVKSGLYIRLMLMIGWS